MVEIADMSAIHGDPANNQVIFSYHSFYIDVEALESSMGISYRVFESCGGIWLTGVGRVVDPIRREQAVESCTVIGIESLIESGCQRHMIIHIVVP
ncbi:hypothetical protein OI69_16660 [Pectobacterium fontis]|uniref:Uncharacterized protein n=1 Tax=Pectobacterium fontis TaxID=2558042 RepID=A0A7V8IGF8_9GAMM|nr:hypothetical protein OI69_16660 [Pectobacterium fontis]